MFVFLLVVVYCPLYSQSVPVEEIKKDADKLFKEEDYSAAYKLYSQLVSNYPKEPEYNFRLGVCMIYSEPNKKKSIEYLKFAVNNPDKTTKDAQFYLAKAYHINYLFDEAISNYRLFKSTASGAQLKKYQVDREISSCENGKHLLSTFTDIEVMNRVAVSENDYFRTYKKIGGKLLVKPDEFKSGVDKKKKEKSVVFLPNGSNVVYYSSYGENTETGKDIYTASKLPDGTYSKGEKVNGINTEFDEDYPFLHPNGTTLYFASKGHNSMGGYDIFKSVYNEETNAWSAPVNMEFPINSPDDDYLFVTDSLETTAYFSTGRQSVPGKIDVLKVKTKRRNIDVLALSGQVLEGDPPYDRNSTIIVKDLFDQKEIGRYTADESGNYTMELPNGGKLLFTVETNGLETQTSQVTLPIASATKPCRQSISYENGKLKVLNYFDEPAKDDDYKQYLGLIEKKAKLDVNEGESRPETPAATDSTKVTLATTSGTKKPTITEQSGSMPAKNIDNKQVAKLAKQDAQEAKTEAAQLMRDYIAANEEAIKQKDAGDKKLAEAEAAIKAAELITNETEKNSALEKAYTLKANAEIEKTVSGQLIDFAAAIDIDAKNEERAAELNAEYAKELEKSTAKVNTASPAKLESLQKEITDLDKKEKSSEAFINNIKTNAEQKETQIKTLQDQNAGITANLQEIKTAITDKEQELANTKKKSAKQNISAQISELKAEEDEKLRQIDANDVQIQTITDELIASRTVIDLATRISAENLSVAALDNAVNQKVTSGYLQEKYSKKIAITDPASLENVNESSRQLSNYNKEIDGALQAAKADLAKTKNKTAKQELSNEIKRLESVKKQNQSQIASNNARIKEINKSQTIAATETANTTFVPLTASSPEEAVTKLDNLNKQLSTSEIENFDYNAYQNPQAQSLKIEADAKINEAIARQKMLKDEIASSKQAMSSEQFASGSVSISELYKSAEELSVQAQSKRTEAKSKKGAEKDKLLQEAKDLDEKASQQNIEAAELIQKDYAAITSTNEENIKNLLAENKTTGSELDQAKALSEEAVNALKKAAAIRNEANSMTSAGAKLGGYSNAEEKEAYAVLKQQQAIDILIKNNPEYTLKTAQTSTSVVVAADNTNKPDVNAQLSTVNKGLSELAVIKTESYQKLNAANQTEIDQLLTSLKNNPSVESSPLLKTEILAIEKKSESAKALKSTSDNSSVENDKLNNLVLSVKKQNEVLKQLSAVSASVSSAAVASAPASTTETGTQANNAGSTPTVSAEEDNELSKLAELSTEGAELGTIAEQDTSAAQVLTYFEVNKPQVRNAEANTQVTASLLHLKNLEDQYAASATEMTKAQKRLAGANSGIVSTEDMNEFADELIEEADPLMNKALELKKSAEGKEGEEKSLTLAKAREIELEAQDKLLQASDFRQQANESEFKTNSAAISELMEKLKTDNPDLSAQLEERRLAYAPLKTQVNNLREEANALNNKAAKLGAISNAEEKELELITKQKALLAELQKQYPDYVVKQVGGKNPQEDIDNLSKGQAEIREKQFAELTALTNAFSLDYEATKNSIPQNLSTNQQKAKQNAENLNAESKKLLIQSSTVSNPAEKFQLLSLAAKSGKTALDELSKVVPAGSAEIDELAEIGKRLISDNETDSKAASNTVKIDGLEVVRGNAYSAANPIPMDARMEDGLIFRVQIGAFKTQLPNNAFKGLSPLNGETTSNGYFRYTAGNFNQIEKANAVKNDLRNLGYRDAFVVVYYNGKRITLGEAIAMMEKEGIKMDPNAPQTAGITANANVPKATVNTALQESVVVTKELEQIDGLLYTIQIGVYTKQVTKPQILSLRPVFREQLSNGLYRYTAGIYTNSERLLIDKDRVVSLGVKDAFVSAYLNGKRVSYAEAKEKQETDPSVKLEAENPIVFPEKQAAPALNPFEQLIAATPGNIQPYKNNVSAYPAALPDNGVKEGEQGISYKVQIGAFSKQVPADVAAKYASIKSWPIDNKRINGLFIYNVGNFTDVKFAKELKEEIVRLGINDAFITVYRDGQKLYGPEAENLIR